LPIVADHDPGFLDYYARKGFANLDKDLEDVTVQDALDEIAHRWRVAWDFKDGWIEVVSPRAEPAMMGELDLRPIWHERKQPAASPTRPAAPDPSTSAPVAGTPSPGRR